MIAASLKVSGKDLIFLRAEGFRDHMIAASLKGIVGASLRELIAPFPRSYDRGLIEGSPALGILGGFGIVSAII